MLSGSLARTTLNFAQVELADNSPLVLARQIGGLGNACISTATGRRSEGGAICARCDVQVAAMGARLAQERVEEGRYA
jgi:hypothetical protein